MASKHSRTDSQKQELHEIIRQHTSGNSSIDFNNAEAMEELRKAIETDNDSDSDGTVHRISSTPSPPPFFRLIRGKDDAGPMSLGCAACCMIIGFIILCADIISSNDALSPGAIVGYLIISISLLHVCLASYCFQKIDIGYDENMEQEKYITIQTTHCFAMPLISDCCTCNKYGPTLTKDEEIGDEIKIIIEDFKMEGCKSGGRIYLDVGMRRDVLDNYKGNDHLIFVDKIERKEEEVQKIGSHIERGIKKAIVKERTYKYKSEVGIHEDIHCCCK